MNKPSSLLTAAVLAASVSFGCGGSAPQAGSAASVASPSAAGDADDGLARLTNEQLVRKLLDVTGASDLGKQVADGMMESFRKMPNLPAGFIERFKQNMRVETLIELIVPIYLKHYDKPTLMAAIRFYQSEPGRAVVKATPLVTAESMEAGKAWGTELAKKTLKDLGIDSN